MLNHSVSAKLIIFTVIGVALAGSVALGSRQTVTAGLIENTSGVGLITVNAGQTARLVVTTPGASTSWGNDRPETLVFGFDVFKPATTQAAAGDVVQKHFLLERRVREVSLGRAEAASFDLSSDVGLLHVRPIVLGDGSVRKFDVSVELINRDGTVATAALLTAGQGSAVSRR